MNFVLIGDSYPPLRNSAAIQLKDLAHEFVAQGHSLVILTPSNVITQPWTYEVQNGVSVIKLRAPKIKDINFVSRAIGEVILPYAMIRNLNKSPLNNRLYDGVIWYSPTIFFGPLVSRIKRKSSCRSYLIVRDIFPDWVVDLKLLKKRLVYRFFKFVERYQYSLADVIGVQTKSNLEYFDQWKNRFKYRVEVLENWFAPTTNTGSSIKISETILHGKIIFVYAGNMGVAQGLDIMIELASFYINDTNIGFLFVGRGSEYARLKNKAKSLPNTLFCDEIAPEEIPGLLNQCDIGIISLDVKHKAHNIPGKFLTYMQNGLPVIASINPGNELQRLIEGHQVGKVTTDYSKENLYSLSSELLAELRDNKEQLSERCREVFDGNFTPAATVKQICSHF